MNLRKSFLFLFFLFFSPLLLQSTRLVACARFGDRSTDISPYATCLSTPGRGAQPFEAIYARVREANDFTGVPTTNGLHE